MLEKPQITISPNPASDYIEINPGKVILSEAKDLKIYNALGECVINLTPALSEGEGERIDVSALPLGVYFVSVNNGKELLTGSFIILR